jgi:hypothetical protein
LTHNGPLQQSYGINGTSPNGQFVITHIDKLVNDLKEGQAAFALKHATNHEYG